MTLAEYWDTLDKHDWYYDYSDDFRVWRAGDTARKKLLALAETGGRDFKELYNDFSKHHFSGKDWGTERAPKPPKPEGPYMEDAIKASIVHWEQVKAGKEQPSPERCSLCVASNYDCILCPVYKRTGRFGCRSTPYSAVVNHLFLNTKDHRTGTCNPGCGKCQTLADAEIEFLKSLLKE